MKLDIQLFASGSVTINGTLNGAGGNYAKFYAIRSYTQDLDEVTTTEIITIYLQRLSSYVSSYQNSAPLVVKADGKNIFSGNVSFNLGSITVGSSVKLTEFSRTLPHDSDGKYADYTLSATLTTGTGIGNGNLNGKITTPTIQTSFSVASSNFNIGNTVPINVGVNNVNYTYTLRYEIGTRTGTIATNQTNGSYVWTMADDLINQIKIDNPKTKTVNVKIYCDTYNGETLKGTKNTTVDGTIVDIPEIDVPTRVEQVAKIQALTNSQYVVKDVSKFKFTFGTTAPIGTTIAKYVVYIGDRTIESTTNEFIVENIIEHTNGITHIATQRIDARGNPSEIVISNVPFIDYTKCEYISTTSTIERDNLTSIVANLKANWYNGQIGTTQNVLTLAYKYKEKTASTYTTGSTTITSSDLGVDKVLETLDNTKVYDFVFTIEDLIYTGGEMSKPVPSSEYVMCEYENGVDFKNAWIKGKQVVTEDKIPTKSKMTIGLSANQTHKSTTKVALNKVMDSVGDKFTLSNNGIKIGAGVTKVKVSANILQQSNAVNVYGGYITKNGTGLNNAVNVGFNTITNTNSWAFFHTGISPIIIDVVEGDIIYLCSYVGATSTVTLQAYAGRAVNLTVEEI